MVSASPSRMATSPIRAVRSSTSMSSAAQPATHGLPRPACDDCRVGGHASARRQDALGGQQAVDVVRGRLGADEDDVLAVRAPRGCRVRVEDRETAGRSRRGAEAGRDHLELGARIDRRMQELLELGGIDPLHGLVPRQQALTRHVDRGTERSGRGALGATRLQQVEASALDRELDVLDVAVVPFERGDRGLELCMSFGQHRAHLGHRQGCPRAGDDVLALRLGEELAVEARPAGRGVTAEADARRRVRVSVSEHHLHDVRRGARILGDPRRGAIDLGAGGVPGVEDRRDGGEELLFRILRKVGARREQIDAAEGVDQLEEVVMGGRGRLAGLERFELLREKGGVDAGDDLAVHLDQSAIVVEQEVHRSRVGLPDDGVAHPEVQDGLHHPRHRDRAAGADGDEQRALGVAEALARALLENREVLLDLDAQLGRQRPRMGEMVAAGLGRDGEPERDR